MKRLLLILLFSPLAFGQGFFASPQLALKTVNGLTSPLANAVITVCAKNTSGIPCSPALTGTIFSDSALTQSLSNPFQADLNGNYIFAAAPGQYTVTVTGTGFIGFSYQVTTGANVTATGTFTNTQCNVYFVSQIGTTNPCTYYTSQQGGNHQTDAGTFIVTAPVGATSHQFNGVNGACITNAVSSPLGGGENCVGLYGSATANVSSSAAWGANTVTTDVVGAAGTVLIGYEADMNVQGSPNRVQGFYMTGIGITGTMPPGPVMGTIIGGTSAAFGFGASFPSSSTTQLPVMYASSRGSAAVGLWLDANCYTGACNSQSIQIGANNGTTAFLDTIQEDQIGELQISSSGTGVGVGLPNYSFAQLNASATNGTFLYCTNCKNVVDDAATAGAACITGGHGAFAKRENARWDCN